MAPALISGNAVVIKPAELTPLSATHLARALQDAGLPAGVLNVVHGKGRVVGDALARDPRVAALSFTGSTAVGLGLQEILNARRARVQLEMGGKNAYLVLDDADPRKAAAGGRRRRVRAHRPGLHRDVPGLRHPRHPRRVPRGARRGGRARTPPATAWTAAPRWAPVVSRQQFEQDQAAVRSAVERGAILLHGAYDGDPAGAAALPGRRAHRPAVRRRRRDRGDLRAGRGRAGGRRLRGRPRRDQRLPLRPHRRHLHRLPGAVHGLRRPRAGRRHQGQPSDGGPGPERAVRRREGLLHQHVPRAGRGPRWTSSPGARPSTRVCSAP